jgi:RNA polymerase primary sigma factor
MEAELKPKVLETFDRIAGTTSRCAAAGPGGRDKTKLSPSQERKLQEAEEEIIEDVKSLSLNRTASIRWSSSSTTSTSG